MKIGDRYCRRAGLLLVALALVLALALLSACAPTGPGRHTELLLRQDYHELNDEQLQSYYRGLSDQLARETRARRQAGIITRPGEAKRLELLRGRWNEVREELRRRQSPP